MAGLDFSGIKSVKIPEGVCKKIVNKSTGDTLWEEASSMLDYFYIQSEQSGAITIEMQEVGSAPTISLEYSLDGTNWTEFKSGNQTTVTLSGVGKKAYFRGDNNSLAAKQDNNFNNFVVSGEFSVGGNIMSLLDSTLEQQELTDTKNRYAFVALFDSCSGLKYADKLTLPSDYIPLGAYANLFWGCSNLETAPTILATQVYSYGMYYIFAECKKLRSCSIFITSTSMASYALRYAFSNCNGLEELHVRLDSIGSGNTSSWLLNAGTNASSPKFYCPSSLVISSRDSNRVPSNFEIIREDV